MASIKRMVAAAEAGVLDFVAAVVPWLAPTPTAYIAYSHLLTVLQLPTWVAVAGALVVEGLGLSVIHTALGFWRADGLRSWRLWLAIGAGIFYLAVVTSVNVLLDRGLPVETLAKSLLSFTSVPAALILALRAQDKRSAQIRQAELDAAAAESERARLEAAKEVERQLADAERRLSWEHEQAERQQAAEIQERQLRLAQAHEARMERLRLRATASLDALHGDGRNASDAPKADAHNATDARVAKAGSKHDATLQQFVADNPSATPSQIERATGINRGTVSRWLRRNAVAQSDAPGAPGAPGVVVHVNGVAKESV